MKNLIKIIILIGAIIAFIVLSPMGRFEVQFKLSQIAQDNNITYQEASDYCLEAITSGNECYYITK